MGEYLGRNSIKPITDGLRDFKNLAAKNPLLKDETYADELNTESGGILGALNEVDEKIRSYVQNLVIAGAYLKDTDESILTTENGEQLYLDNPIYRFDNVTSDIYRVVENVSDTSDYSDAVSAALTNGKKIVYLSKGTFPITGAALNSASDYILRGYGPKHTRLTAYSSGSFQISYKNNITFENIWFDGLVQINLSRCTNITFKNCRFTNFTYRGFITQNCSAINFYDCEFDEIGTEITNQNSSGEGINFMDTEDIQVIGCRFNEIKSNTLRVYNSFNGFICRNNVFTNTVFGAVQLWRAERTGDKPILISNNLMFNIGFGTPPPDMPLNEYGQVTGVGCAAIYGGNTGTTTTFSLENVAVKDNVIIKCREVGIEGTWQNVENNIIFNPGVESGTGEGERYTPSRAGVHITVSQTYKTVVKGNTIISDDSISEGITTTGGGENCRLVITGNYISMPNDRGLGLTLSQIKSLEIINNVINAGVTINAANKAMDCFVFDSSCKKIVLPLPIVFKSGYVNTHEKVRASGRNFDISSSISCTQQADGSITVNQFGYAGIKLDYSDLLYENADISIWAKIKYNSEANKVLKLSAEPNSAYSGYVITEGTEGEDTILNVLLKPSGTTNGEVMLKAENVSASYAASGFAPLYIKYAKIYSFVKEGE